jgi:hypothetical protein
MIQLTLNALEVRWQRMSVFGDLCADSRGRLCTFWQLAQWQMALAPTAGPTGMSWLAQDTAFETERLEGLLPSAEYLIAPHMQPPVMVVDIVTVSRTIEYLVSGLRSRLGAESVDEIGGLGWMYDLFVVEGRYIYIYTRCDTHLRGPKIGWDPCRAPRKMYSQSERGACLASVSTSDFRSPLGFVDD